MKIRSLSINSRAEVIVKIVREVLNLFKMEIVGRTGEADYAQLSVVNRQTGCEPPSVMTEVYLFAVDGTCEKFYFSSAGKDDELPRAAVTADEIGAYADFFSFGTNDLTQTTFGFSRDDVESAFIPQYLNKKILKANPFETLDVGVAKLVEMGVKGGHAANETIVCGICGETGGDPDSIQMYYDLGLDYVSCSPYRVPIARLAGAQAKINSNGGPKKLG